MGSLCEDCQCPGRDSNSAPPEQESRSLPVTLTFLDHTSYSAHNNNNNIREIKKLGARGSVVG
jgi:hypothetical protein